MKHPACCVLVSAQQRIVTPSSECVVNLSHAGVNYNSSKKQIDHEHRASAGCCPKGNKLPTSSIASIASVTARIVGVAIVVAIASVAISLGWLLICITEVLVRKSLRVFGWLLAADFGMSILLTVGALNLGPLNLIVSKKIRHRMLEIRLTISRLGTLFAVVSSFLAVAASNKVHVSGLVTILGYMAFLATIATSSAASIWAVFGEVAG